MAGFASKKRSSQQESKSAVHDVSNETIQRAAREGMLTTSVALPYADQIQRSFGRHRVSQIQAHVGPEATASASAMKASGFASGNHVVFKGAPSLHTAAHEAAHVVQQQSGVKLSGGIGTSAPVQRKFLDDKGAVMSDLDVDTEAGKHALSADQLRMIADRKKHVKTYYLSTTIAALLAGTLVPPAPKPTSGSSGWTRREGAGYVNPSHKAPSVRSLFEDAALSPVDTSRTKEDWLYSPSRRFNTYSPTHTQPPEVVKGHSETVMGHGPVDAVDDWNTDGHRRPRSQNLAHNKDAGIYHGLEERKKSAKSGGNTKSRYRSPSPTSSHPSHFDREHADFDARVPWKTYIKDPTGKYVLFTGSTATPSTAQVPLVPPPAPGPLVPPPATGPLVPPTGLGPSLVPSIAPPPSFFPPTPSTPIQSPGAPSPTLRSSWDWSPSPPPSSWDRSRSPSPSYWDRSPSPSPWDRSPSPSPWDRSPSPSPWDRSPSPHEDRTPTRGPWPPTPTYLPSPRYSPYSRPTHSHPSPVRTPYPPTHSAPIFPNGQVPLWYAPPQPPMFAHNPPPPDSDDVDMEG